MITGTEAAPRNAASFRTVALAAAALFLLVCRPALAHDPRVAELVSPADNEGELAALGFLSPDGTHIGYTAVGAFAGAQQTGGPQAYVAQRTPGGWVTTPIDTPGGNTAPRAIADAGTRILWQTSVPLDADDTLGGTNDLFLRDGAGPIVRLSTGPLRTFGVSPTFEAATGDLSTVFFESPNALAAPDDQRTAGVGLYAWRSGTLSNVTVPDDASAKRGAMLGGGPARVRDNAINADGSRAVITSPSVTGPLKMRLWLLDGAGPARALTGAPAADERFDGAAADQRTVVLSTKDALTGDDTDGGQLDVYAVDTTVDPPAVTHISPGNGTTCSLKSFSGCEARTVAVADDGSTIAYVSPEVLAPGATANGANLYVHRGTATSFVGTLATTDAPLTADPERDTRISADGSRLAFLTAAPLTADDTDAVTDLYVYDTTTGTLTRVSQGPAGGNAAAPVTLSAAHPGYAPSSAEVAPPRNLTADGRCAFFETIEGLVSTDTNGVGDVYESCDGVLALVSAGTGTDDSHYVNSSADGTDVEMITTDPLSLADLDGGASIYDLRVGGRPDPGPPARCAGDACQGTPTPAAERPAVATFGAASEGAGGAGVASAPFVLRPPTRLGRQRAVRTGFLDLIVEMPSAGRLDLSATARSYKPASAAKALRAFTKKSQALGAGVSKVRLRIPAKIRRRLSRGPLFVTVTAHAVAQGVDADDSAGFVLSRPRSKR